MYLIYVADSARYFSNVRSSGGTRLSFVTAGYSAGHRTHACMRVTEPHITPKLKLHPTAILLSDFGERMKEYIIIKDVCALFYGCRLCFRQIYSLIAIEIHQGPTGWIKFSNLPGSSMKNSS